MQIKYIQLRISLYTGQISRMVGNKMYYYNNFYYNLSQRGYVFGVRVRNLKFATYLKFATCENTNKINELW